MDTKKIILFLCLICVCLILPININAEETKAEFSIKPIDGKGIFSGETATIKFKLIDPTTGDPKTFMKPAAWISLAKDRTPCRDKVSLYLQGGLGSGADIDLNKYFILTLNSDPTISVIDPFASVKGITQLYTMVMLKSPGDDWVIEGNRLFVTMPLSNQVAVIDTERFKVINNIDAGENPMRAAMQPDRKYLWVTNCTKNKKGSGVTVIDPKELTVITRIRLEAGHHEIAFRDDGRYLYVSNKDNGILSIIDTVDLKVAKEINTGRSPVAIAVSGKKVYVAHSDGSVVIIDDKDHRILGEIKTSQGINAMSFSLDGKLGFAINNKNNIVYIIDASKDSIAHALKISNPTGLSFTKENAYILREAGREMSVIRLSELEKEAQPDILNISFASPPAPAMSSMHIHTNPLFPAPEGNVMLIAQHGLIHYYKEGMQSPMGSFRSYTKSLKAITVFDRKLKEIGPGLYAANIRIPASGKYEVALLAGSYTECFEFEALPNPVIMEKEKLKIEIINPQKTVKSGEDATIQFKLIDTVKNEKKEEINDVFVLAALAPGHKQEQYIAKPINNGMYQVTIKTSSAGIYYLFFSIPSMNITSDKLPPFTMQAVD